MKMWEWGDLITSCFKFSVCLKSFSKVSNQQTTINQSPKNWSTTRRVRSINKQKFQRVCESNQWPCLIAGSPQKPQITPDHGRQNQFRALLWVSGARSTNATSLRRARRIMLHVITNSEKKGYIGLGLVEHQTQIGEAGRCSKAHVKSLQFTQSPLKKLSSLGSRYIMPTSTSMQNCSAPSSAVSIIITYTWFSYRPSTSIRWGGLRN